MATLPFIAPHGVDSNNNPIINVGFPVNDTDAANKDFVSNAANITKGKLPSSVLPDFNDSHGVLVIDTEGNWTVDPTIGASSSDLELRRIKVLALLGL